MFITRVKSMFSAHQLIQAKTYKSLFSQEIITPGFVTICQDQLSVLGILCEKVEG